jgi:hypothetical protein
MKITVQLVEQYSKECPDDPALPILQNMLELIRLAFNASGNATMRLTRIVNELAVDQVRSQ